MIRECKKHGETEYLKREGNHGYICKECYKEKNKKTTAKRKMKMSDLIQNKGGKCQNCGYNKCEEALDFHHLNDKNKSFNISPKLHLPLEKLKEETDKCLLLCVNCHREVHDNVLTIIEEKDTIRFEYK